MAGLKTIIDTLKKTNQRPLLSRVDRMLLDRNQVIVRS